MARQEATSIFSDGLMSDLHPINTPKSVLTDCLNGTYITYNGNEFILQNDMGNYELKNCKLSTNFIPVGIKSYADILYIVSYNPLTKEVEIGSYPSPRRIFSTGTGEKNKSLTPFLLEPDVIYEYTELIETQKQPLYIFGKETNDDSFKLFPGDEFKIDFGNKELEFIYQHLNFYIIDDDNKLYDIDDSEIYLLDELSEDERKKYLTEDGYRKVFWETPGWLAAQYNLYVPDKFNLNIKSLTVPEFINFENKPQEIDGILISGSEFPVTLEMSTQTIITDLLFQDKLKPWDNESENIKIRFLIRRGEKYGGLRGFGNLKVIPRTYKKDADYLYVDIPCKKHNYQDDIITAFTNLKIIWGFDKPEDLSSFTGKIQIKAFPIIYYNKQVIEYDQFNTTFEYDLNDIKNQNEIKIAENTYKWAVDSDSCTISFDLDGPFVNANNISGRYEIYRINRFNYVTETPTDTTVDTSVEKSWSKWKNITQTVNASKFGKLNSNDEFEEVTNITNLEYDSCYLMCDGVIPTLIPKGQNTININWNDSNVISLNEYKNWYAKATNSYATINPIASVGPINPVRKYTIVEDYRYTTPGTKDLNFSKEGGLYKFRIILEQNGNYIKHVDKLLIPSELFNEWFGSVDNYENISGTTWVNKYIDSISVNQLEFNDFSLDFTKQIETDSSNAPWLYYKWNKRFSTYKAVTKNTILPLVKNSSLSINEKFTIDEETETYDKFNVSFKQLLDLIVALRYPSLIDFTWDESNNTFKSKYKASSSSIIEDTLLLQVRYSDLNPNQNTDFVFDLKYLSGNLWNPIIETDIQIKQNSANVISLTGTNDNLDVSLNDLNDNYSVNFGVDTIKLRNKLSSFFPFLDSLNKRYFFGLESTGTFLTGTREPKLTSWWRIKQWNTNFKTSSTLVEKKLTISGSKSNFISSDSFYTNISQQILSRSVGFLYGITSTITVGSGGTKTVGIDLRPYTESGSNFEGELWQTVTTDDGHARTINKTNCIVIPIAYDQCVLLSLTEEQLYALCRIKITDLGPLNDHWYIEELNNLTWTENKNIQANKYSAETKLTIIRVDDYDWKINTSDDMLLNIDYLSTNNTVQNGQVNLLLNLNFNANIDYTNKTERFNEWERDVNNAYSDITQDTENNSKLFKIEVCEDVDDPDAKQYFDKNGILKIFDEDVSTNYREITFNQIINYPYSPTHTPSFILTWFENKFKPINSVDNRWIKGNYIYNLPSPSNQMGYKFDNNKGGAIQSFTYYEELQWTSN